MLNFGIKIWLVSGRSNSIEIKKDLIDTSIYISMVTEIKFSSHLLNNTQRKKKSKITNFEDENESVERRTKAMNLVTQSNRILNTENLN